MNGSVMNVACYEEVCFESQPFQVTKMTFSDCVFTRTKIKFVCEKFVAPKSWAVFVFGKIQLEY